MQKFDVLIVGGGMVGLTLALALRQQTKLTVAIADTLTAEALEDKPEVRVSAINHASQQIFANLGVWSAIENQRIQPYQHMHVWDKAGYGKLDFDHNSVATDDLGWIIENKVIRNALWHKAEQDQGITFFTEEKIQNIAIGDSEVFASFASQMPITAKLIVGADGANSWVRQQMNMQMAFRDYDHHAVVATVKCQQGHQNTAWQVFLPTGPLAFLPLFEKDLCSIVWSTEPNDAERISQLSPEQFAKEITAATDGKLGQVSLQSERFTFPLRMRLVHEFVKDRAILVGDAAHTIHPLAGQGVNLGLLDAASLAQILVEQVNQYGEDDTDAQWANEKALKAYSRWRRSDATDMIAAMEAIKQSFTPQHEVTKLIRGIGMSLLNEISPLKRKLTELALGHKGQLPELAKAKK